MTNEETKQRLIGTWRLISTVSEDLTTGEKSNTWGPNPQGYINYGRDGRMIVSLNRKPSAGVPGSSVTRTASSSKTVPG